MRSKKLTLLIAFLLALFLAIVVFVQNGIEISRENTGAFYVNEKNSVLEECSQIDGSPSDVEHIKEMYMGSKVECLAYRLKTINPIKIHPAAVRYLKEILDSQIAANDRSINDSGVIDVAAYIVATWASRCSDNNHGIVFDYQLHRNWLVDRIKNNAAIANYAAGVITRHGSSDDLEFVVKHFGDLNETARMTVFVDLSLRCDSHSDRLLQQIRLQYPAWWQSRPNLSFECKKCSS